MTLANKFKDEANPYDENAIAVHAHGVGQVGYLSRDDAFDYLDVFDALETHGVSVASCPAFLIGGEPGKPFHGVLRFLQRRLGDEHLLRRVLRLAGMVLDGDLELGVDPGRAQDLLDLLRLGDALGQGHLNQLCHGTGSGAGVS